MMNRSRDGRAFTLLELMVTVTLMAIVIGITTVGPSRLTDQARLRAAASQISAVYRLGACLASRSGTPRIMLLDHRGCRVKKPIYRAGRWEWSAGPRIDLDRKVNIMRVFPWDHGNKNAELEPPWELAVNSGIASPDFGMLLRLNNGLSATIKLDGYTGVTTIEAVHYE